MTILNCAEISSKIQDIFCKTNIYYSLLVYDNNVVTENEILTLCNYLRGQDVPLFLINPSCGEIQEQEQEQDQDVNKIASQYRMFVVPQHMFSSWVNRQGWSKVIEDVSIVFCLSDLCFCDVQRTLDEQKIKTSNDLCLIPL
jgi:hypothetical protein